MIEGFKILYTIIKDKKNYNRTWQETKKEIDGRVKKDSVFKIVEPAVRKAMTDAGMVQREFKA